MNIIANLFFFFALNPFLSPIPFLNTDTTPVSHTISFLTLIYLLIHKKKFEIIKPALFLLIFAFISFFLVSPEANFELRHRVGIFGAFLIYWFSTNFLYLFRFNVLRFSILFHTFFVSLHLFFPNYFVPIGSLFVRTIKMQASHLSMEGFTGRGASGFAAENSFAAILGIVYIFLLFWFFKRGIINKKTLLKYSVISTIPIILSYSASGIFITIFLTILYFFIRFILYIFKNPLIIKSSIFKLITAFILFVFPILIILSNSLSRTRGFNLLTAAINNPSILYLDNSISERLIGISVGFLSLFHYPFGLGGGSYSIVAKNMDKIYDLKIVFSGAYYGIEDTVSSFGRYSSEFGFIFIIIFAYLFYYSNKYIDTFTIVTSTFSLLLILQSFSILFPPTYLLLAVCINNKIRKFESNKKIL